MFGFLKPSAGPKFTALQPDSQIQQLQLLHFYRTFCPKYTGGRLSDYGFRCYSQFEEDGMLLYIFALIGFTNRQLVDLAAGDVVGSNSGNLILNHRFLGLLLEGDAVRARRTQTFYQRHSDTWLCPPAISTKWITRANLNEIISSHGFRGEIDLFLLDMDGVDYWIWKELEVIRPRVVVVEYNPSIGAEKAWTVPYSEDFNCSNGPKIDGFFLFCGASLRAFMQLGREKGYRLIGCNTFCNNAFFVRNDISEELFPEVAVESCFNHPMAILGKENCFPKLKDLGWQEV